MPKCSSCRSCSSLLARMSSSIQKEYAGQEFLGSKKLLPRNVTYNCCSSMPCWSHRSFAMLTWRPVVLFLRCSVWSAVSERHTKDRNTIHPRCILAQGSLTENIDSQFQLFACLCTCQGPGQTWLRFSAWLPEICQFRSFAANTSAARAQNKGDTRVCMLE